MEHGQGLGPLTGGPHCHVSNLRNGHVACPLAIHVPCHSKMLSCHMSNLRNALCHVTLFSGHVDKPYVACRF